MSEALKIHPTSALLSPRWLAAVAALAINDHVIKDVAPGVVSGKLSDLAGMIVAPALLACVLAVRTRGGLLACHVAVGVVFASLKISATAAGWWPWRVVVDPTDLIAVPVLVLAWRWLSPMMQRPLTATARAGLATVAGCVGLLVCAATSPRRDYPANGPMLAADEKSVLIDLNGGIQGFLEMRCDDGVQVSQEVSGRGAVLLARPAAGAECKLQMLGVPGSFGPVTTEVRRIECNVTTARIDCVVKERT